MKGAWGKLYGYNDAGRNVKMQEQMIPVIPAKPYKFNGVGYDTIEEMREASDRFEGIEDSELVKLLKRWAGESSGK